MRTTITAASARKNVGFEITKRPKDLGRGAERATDNFEIEKSGSTRQGESMALVKRGKTWHTHFFVDGVRYRQSLETGDWREAQSKEKILIAQAAQGILSASHKGFGKLAFAQAAESYFSGRKLELRESSQKKERQLLVKPCDFFQQKRLSKITAEDILRFREWRSESGVGPALINMEVGVIRRMLKRARRWHLFGADIRPLKEPRSIGKALSYDEKLSLLHIAGQNEEWQRAEAAMSLALCTTMRDARSSSSSGRISIS
jgi:hypothetical protein